MTSDLSAPFMKTPSLPLALEMVFFGRLIHLPASVNRHQWDGFIQALIAVGQKMATLGGIKTPRGLSPAHYHHLVADIIAVWTLAKEQGLSTPLLGIISHIRTFEAISKIDQEGLAQWTGPALEEAIMMARQNQEWFGALTPDDFFNYAGNVAKVFALDKQEISALPSLLRDRSVDSLRHLSADTVLRILDGVAQFETSSEVPVAIARSFRRALEVLCPELPLPLSGEGLLITLPPSLPVDRRWGLKPVVGSAKVTPVHRPSGPRPSLGPRRRGPSAKR